MRELTWIAAKGARGRRMQIWEKGERRRTSPKAARNDERARAALGNGRIRGVKIKRRGPIRAGQKMCLLS